MKHIEVDLHLFGTKSEMAYSEYRTSTLLLDGAIWVRYNVDPTFDSSTCRTAQEIVVQASLLAHQVRCFFLTPNLREA